jgi:hypothetical protein
VEGTSKKTGGKGAKEVEAMSNKLNIRTRECRHVKEKQQKKGD